MLQDVQHLLDWTPWKRLAKQSNTRVQTARQTWHQGAMSEGTDAGHLQCPHCNQPATAVHLLCLCKETNRHGPPLEGDKKEIEQGINLEFWAQGLLQLPAVQLSTGGAAIQA